MSDIKEPIETQQAPWLPTDAEEAACRGMHPDAELVEREDLEFACIVRPATQREFWDYLDGALAESPDAAPTLALRCSLWRTRAEIHTAIRRAPFLAHRIVEAIESMAGGDKARGVYPLDAKTPDDLLDELGIPKEIAADLRSRYHHKGQLGIVHHDVGTVAIRAPADGIAREWKDTYATKEKARACFDLAMACIVFPAVDSARALLERAPAMPYNVLLGPILDLGGAGSKAKRKKL